MLLVLETEGHRVQANRRVLSTVSERCLALALATDLKLQRLLAGVALGGLEGWLGCSRLREDWVCDG